MDVTCYTYLWFSFRLPKYCHLKSPSWWEFCCLVCEWMSVILNMVRSSSCIWIQSCIFSSVWNKKKMKSKLLNTLSTGRLKHWIKYISITFIWGLLHLTKKFFWNWDMDRCVFQFKVIELWFCDIFHFYGRFHFNIELTNHVGFWC